MDIGPLPEASFFAPAGRADEASLKEQVEQCVNSPLALGILSTLDGLVVVLNEQRQILAANDDLLDALRAEGLDDPLGVRWGESFHCVHVDEGPDGCGTSRACSCCGAILGLLAAQAGQTPQTRECHMTVRRRGQWQAREYQVKTTTVPFPFGPLLVQVFHDVSDSHRREVLESSFLHDLANSLTSLTAWSEIMSQGIRAPAEAAAKILAISAMLSEVVTQQRLLHQAEQGALTANPRTVPVLGLLETLRDTLTANPIFKHKHLCLTIEAPAGTEVRTDPTLVARVLLNMGTNAIEACQPGETVRLGFAVRDGRARFEVHNPGVIPDDVALRIFQRSFSTRGGKGRGLGTYSMKILGENVLGGSVGFQSDPAAGTAFHLDL